MDNEVSGEGNQYDYGFRIYNPRIARFLSVDPLTKEYPWYTPYQFAGNKPIWAIDVDGLEEFIFQYRLENGKATLINKIDNKRLIPDIDKIGAYKVYDKRTGLDFDPKELGMVQYQYFDGNGKILKKRRNYEGEFEDGENELMPEHAKNLFGSIYIGGNNPTYINEEGKKKPDYRREPQDETDAAALQHDKDYDAAEAAGPPDAFFNTGVKPADQKLTYSSLKVQRKFIYGGKDDITGRDVSLKSYARATFVRLFFSAIIHSTKDKNVRQVVKGAGKGASHIKP